MKKIFLLIFFILSIVASTKIYGEYWKGKNPNAKYQFYDGRTFGINIYGDPCTQINDNKKFRTFVTKNFKCTGNWRIDNKWICSNAKKGVKRSNNCYHVEHIIDIA